MQSIRVTGHEVAYCRCPNDWSTNPPSGATRPADFGMPVAMSVPLRENEFFDHAMSSHILSHPLNLPSEVRLEFLLSPSGSVEEFRPLPATAFQRSTRGPRQRQIGVERCIPDSVNLRRQPYGKSDCAGRIPIWRSFLLPSLMLFPPFRLKSAFQPFLCMGKYDD